MDHTTTSYGLTSLKGQTDQVVLLAGYWMKFQELRREIGAYNEEISEPHDRFFQWDCSQIVLLLWSLVFVLVCVRLVTRGRCIVGELCSYVLCY